MLREIIPFRIRKAVRSKLPKLYLRDWLSIKMGSMKIKYLDLCPLWKCNARCPTCESWKRDPTTMISAKQANQILNNPIFKHLEVVIVEGGEPSLWPHLKPFVYSMAQKCIVSIITNCIESKRILEYAIHFFPLKKNIRWCLSLNGIGKMHDASRGYVGSYDKVLTVAKGLKELGYIVTFSFVPFQPNESDFEKVKDIADEMNIGMSVCHPCNSGKFGDSKWQPVFTERIEEMNKKLQKRWIDRWVDEHFFANVKERKLMPCWAGRRMVHINPYGQILTCSMNEKGIIGQVEDNGVEIDKEMRRYFLEEVIPKDCEYNKFGVCNNCMINWTARRSFPTLLKWRMGL